jgi:hypothetical protein
LTMAFAKSVYLVPAANFSRRARSILRGGDTGGEPLG